MEVYGRQGRQSPFPQRWFDRSDVPGYELPSVRASDGEVSSWIIANIDRDDTEYRSRRQTARAASSVAFRRLELLRLWLEKWRAEE
jgi:hypothetical protein